MESLRRVRSDHRRGRAARRSSAALLSVLSLSVGLIACSDNSSGSSSRSSTSADQSTVGSDAPTNATPANDDTTPDAQGVSDDMVAGAPGSLSGAGIQIVQHETDLTSIDGPLVLTAVQADRYLADVDPAAGVLGADIDALVPMPAGVPPMSYLIAGWLTTYDSPGATTANEWMGDQDWPHAPAVRFPEAVLALFVQDMAAAADAGLPADPDAIDLAPFLPPGPTDIDSLTTASDPASSAEAGAMEPIARGGFGTSRTLAMPAHLALAGPCSTVVNFVAAVLGGIFNALRISPVSGGGFLGALGNIFVGVWNAAVGLASGVVNGLISTLTEPVVGVIRIAIATLGVATVFASYFRDTKLQVTLEPGQASGYRFAVGTEADITGQFIGRGETLTGNWPDALVDCAGTLGVPLPTAVGPGSKAAWTVSQGQGVINPGGLDSTVGADLTVRLPFATGRESEEQAKGQSTNGTAFATVKVPRKEVDDLLRLGRDQVVAAKASLIGRIPLAPLRDAADQLFSSIVDPVLARLDAEIAGAAGGLFTLSGTGMVTVSFHLPPDTTTSSPPSSTEPPQDFCTLYQELVDWSASNSPNPVVPWAQEIVRRLEEMRPIAPAELLSDVDVELRVYNAVAESADVLVLIQTTEPLPDAAARIGAFCGISPQGG